ncbi:SH3 domain-containing protein [uncultured Roseibium sp.]|uniref:SH3 domain-containing protein n=1 Tax=uncultured Roseibium sp. TaxID=1936171 RepID=UPI002630F35A|nr:SH3 domain-containing protein [uncultured Roseibium sp.]
MYSVIAPANSCDISTSYRPDNVTTKPPKKDLKLVHTTDTAALALQDPEPLDASKIAAKILHMHATSEEAAIKEARKPKLLDGHEEPDLEIPGVFRRPRDSSETTPPKPAVVPLPHAIKQKAKSGLQDPKSKMFLISGLLIAVIGSAGFAIGMAAANKPVEEDARLVTTEAISAEPTIEGLIADDAASPVSATPVHSSGATTAQIENAKERIRLAFAERGTLTTPQVAPLYPQTNDTRPSGSEQPTLDLGDKAIGVDAIAGNNAQQVAAGTTATIAPSLAEPAPQPETPLQSDPTLRTTPVELTETASVTPKTTSDPGTAGTDYPNKGTITASVNLRKSEDKDGTILAVIPAGTEISFNTCGTWWCGVDFDGQTGFVGKKFIERTASGE